MTRFHLQATLWAVMATALPGLASAQAVEVECLFTQECFEAEACDEASFSVRLGKGTVPGEVVMRTPAETIAGTVRGNDTSSLVWSARTPSSEQLLSWGADGTARYTLHLTDGPAVVSYLGQCEAQ